MGQAISKYPPNGVRELLHVSIPLMVSVLSGFLMLLVDRFILGHYSIEAMNAASGAVSVDAAFTFPLVAFVLSAEAFVGQYNGAGQLRSIGPVVWQVIWFALASSVVMVPAAIWLAPYLLADVFIAEGLTYLRLILGFGCLFPLISALSAFFIGRGRPKLVTLVSIFGNLLNAVLAVMWVFGYCGFPALGAVGAGLAAVFSWFVQVGILGAFFLKQDHRERYDTGNWCFSWSEFKKCWSLGWSNAALHLLECSVWGGFMQLIAGHGPQYVSVWLMQQNFWFLFGFFFKSLSQGITAVAANRIGAGQAPSLGKLLRSMCRVLFFFALSVGVCLILWGKALIRLFYPEVECPPDILHAIDVTLPFYGLSVVADSLCWGFYGFLVAGGDTRFTLLVSIVGLLIFIPISYGVVLVGAHPIWVQIVLVVYFFVLFAAYAFRYNSGRWIRVNVAPRAIP